MDAHRSDFMEDTSLFAYGTWTEPTELIPSEPSKPSQKNVDDPNRTYRTGNLNRTEPSEPSPTPLALASSSGVIGLGLRAEEDEAN